MTVRRLWIAAAIAVLTPLAWYLGSPLFLNRQVDEAFPMSRGATVPQGMTRQQAEDEMLRALRTRTAVKEAMPAAAGAPQALLRGSFSEVDRIHRAEGIATVYRIGKDLVLRFDPFMSANGPDLYVYLSGHPRPRSNAEFQQGGVFEVAHLRGNIGAQNYALPPDLDLTTYKSVVIYCRPFHVVFSTATLAAR